MTTLLITWAILATLFLIGWCRFGKELSERKLLIDKSMETTHNWTVEEGIKPNTDIYKFPNTMYAMHDKHLNRLYVYNYYGFPAQLPIDTTGILVQEFEETLLGIEKR